MNPLFTEEDISVIDKNLGYIVFDWAKHLISHIMSQARNSNVKVVYMNTPSTLDSGDTQDQKVEYFYERLPLLMGFKLEKANLRNRGNETLWAYHLDTITSSALRSLIKCSKKQISLEELPRKYQGAFLSILGEKPFYTQEDIDKVLSIVESKKPNKKEVSSKYYYDWNKEWSGSQRFSKSVNEMVVLQKLPQETQKWMESFEYKDKNGIIRKPLLDFWSVLLSQSQHFGPDVIGFALVSKVSSDKWVINEIQTDAINAYLKIKREYRIREKIEEKQITWETLQDMLTANNRTKWIPILDVNAAMREQMLKDPNIIHRLPDDSQDLNKWLKEQQERQYGKGSEQEIDLMHIFQQTDFNTRIFRTY